LRPAARLASPAPGSMGRRKRCRAASTGRLRRPRSSRSSHAAAEGPKSGPMPVVDLPAQGPLRSSCRPSPFAAVEVSAPPRSRFAHMADTHRLGPMNPETRPWPPCGRPGGRSQTLQQLLHLWRCSPAPADRLRRLVDQKEWRRRPGGGPTNLLQRAGRAGPRPRRPSASPRRWVGDKAWAGGAKPSLAKVAALRRTLSGKSGRGSARIATPLGPPVRQGDEQDGAHSRTP